MSRVLPEWMFDSQRCAAMVLLEEPVPKYQAALELRRLLDDELAQCAREVDAHEDSAQATNVSGRSGDGDGAMERIAEPNEERSTRTANGDASRTRDKQQERRRR